MPQLTWLGDADAKRAARRVPYRMLDPVEQVGDPAAQNWLIQGDNLDALKALMPFYAGRVKCIFIDPPYNTKSAFEHYDDNLEHSQWLSMMYPRLELLRDLLDEDSGSLWISIDDNEGHYLKTIADEVMGRRNFVATFIWQKVDSPNDNKVPITPDHEFVLCYERKKDHAGFRKMTDLSVLDAYTTRDVEGRLYRDRLLRKNGKNSLRTDRPSMWFSLTAPDGKEVFPIHEDGREARWSHSRKGITNAEVQGRLIWKQRPRGDEIVWVPYIREYAPDSPARPHPTILLDVKTSRQAKAHVRDLLPDAPLFETIKPEQLIARILQIATNPGDLVLDSFLGSGTTASVAHKMGRRWIGIEMGPHMQSHCLPRLRAVVDGEQGGISQALDWGGGGGFRFFRLGEPAFDANGRIHPSIRFPALAAYVWFLEAGAPHPTGRFDSPLLGLHADEAIHLLYNGILGDRSASGGNVLTHAVLDRLVALAPGHRGPRVVYGEASRISPARLKDAGVVFRQIPYDIRMR